MTLLESAILPTDQHDDVFLKGLDSAKLKCV